MNKSFWSAVSVILFIMGLAPAILADTIPDEWLVFAGSPRKVYFQRVIRAAELRGDIAGVNHMKELAAAPPAIPPDLTSDMSRYYPGFAATYSELQTRVKEAITYKEHKAVDQWRVDEAEADLQLVAFELQKGQRASTSFMEKYLHDAAWALNHHIVVQLRIAKPAPPPPSPLPPTADITVTPSQILRGDCAMLTWQTTNATEALINNEAVSTSGSRKVCPEENTNYLLVANGPGGRADDQANLIVTLPPPHHFRIHFDFDEWAIRNDALDTMSKIATLMREYPEMQMTVEGHTDAKGTDDYNMSLGERRAKSVLDYFLAHYGLDPSRFSLISKGESEPLVSNVTIDGKDNPEGRAYNRRAEFIEKR